MLVTLPSPDQEGPFPGYVSDRDFDMGASKRCSFFSVPGIASFLRDIVPKGVFFSKKENGGTAVNSTPHSLANSKTQQDFLFKSVLQLFRIQIFVYIIQINFETVGYFQIYVYIIQISFENVGYFPDLII
jgi:hypothetical protein